MRTASDRRATRLKPETIPTEPLGRRRPEARAEEDRSTPVRCGRASRMAGPRPWRSRSSASAPHARGGAGAAEVAPSRSADGGRLARPAPSAGAATAPVLLKPDRRRARRSRLKALKRRGADARRAVSRRPRGARRASRRTRPTQRAGRGRGRAQGQRRRPEARTASAERWPPTGAGGRADEVRRSPRPTARPSAPSQVVRCRRRDRGPVAEPEEEEEAPSKVKRSGVRPPAKPAARRAATSRAGAPARSIVTGARRE